MKVLCIERRAGTSSALGEVLTERGHEVRFEAPEGALEAIRTRRVDAVLLPYLAGEHLLEDLRRLVPRLPCIAVGSEDSALAAAQATARGALGYVAWEGEALSPAMEEVLVALVERAAARARFEADREITLRENQRLRKFYGDVINGVRQGIVVIDQGGKIRFRNPAAQRFLGEEDQPGPHDGRAAPKLLQMLVEALTSGQSQSQTIAYQAENQRVFLDINASVLHGADGKTSGAVATVADRSTEKYLEQQLVHTERLATLGSLLASIAHEINNTLTSVTGCAEMGLELADGAEEAAKTAPDGPARESLVELGNEIRIIFDMVLQAGVSAQTIANNMLQYSRQGKPSHRTQENVNRLIEKTLKLMGKHLGVEKVDLELTLDPDGPQVLIEPSKLQQALVNLIVNAVHALLDVPLERRKLHLETRTEEDEVRIAVRDRGPGISPRRLERIFKPFFTTKGHGTGLGLFITRRVVEDEGGRITVESVVGEGTCFTIHLPVATRQPLFGEPKADPHQDATRVE